MRKDPKQVTNDKLNRGPILAAIAATGIMLASGVAFNAMAARLGTRATALAIAPAVLASFPAQIGNWTGEEVPLDEAIAEKTDADAHISRRYTRDDTGESVYLYVACGVDWEMMFHRPDVCYPANGWATVGRSARDLPLRDGAALPCSIFRFARGEFEAQEMIVLYYCIADGRLYNDVSLLRSRVWGVLGAVEHLVQVQIVPSSGGFSTGDSLITIASEFATDSAASIAELSRHIQERQDADGHHGFQEEGDCS